MSRIAHHNQGFKSEVPNYLWAIEVCKHAPIRRRAMFVISFKKATLMSFEKHSTRFALFRKLY